MHHFLFTHVHWLWMILHRLRLVIYDKETFVFVVALGVGQTLVAWFSGYLAIEALPEKITRRWRHQLFFVILGIGLLVVTAYVGYLNDKNQHQAELKTVEAETRENEMKVSLEYLKEAAKTNNARVLETARSGGSREKIITQLEQNTQSLERVSAPIPPRVSAAPQQTTTTTSLVVSPNPATTTQAITITAIISSNSGKPITGTVWFLDGEVPIGSSYVGDSGIATFRLTSLKAGPHSLRAQYLGSSSLDPSISSNVVAFVNEAGVVQTSTTITITPNPVENTQEVNVLVSVVATSGTPTGMVYVYVGSETIGAGPLDGSGIATFHYGGNNLKSGAHFVHAIYVGDNRFGGSESAVARLIVTEPPKTR